MSMGSVALPITAQCLGIANGNANDLLRGRNINSQHY